MKRKSPRPLEYKFTPLRKLRAAVPDIDSSARTSIGFPVETD